MKKNKRAPETMMDKKLKNVQFDLFSQFVSNDKGDVSNTVEFWDRIPKYFLTPKQSERLLTSDGLAKPYKLEYMERDNEGYATKFSVVIQPALIENEDGSYKACFPSVTEELIEEALKKILSDQKFGMHDPDNMETWVKFSLSMLHRELKSRGKERNRNEIKKAILIMSKCNIAFFRDGKEIWNGSILQDLVTVGRDEYLENADSYHIAKLPLFISRAINQLEYRQFNYKRLFECNGQLTRWIYKKLIHRYRQASPIASYHFLFSSLKSSGLLQQSRERDNRKKTKDALDELIKLGVIESYTTDDRKEGRTIVDVKYTVYATTTFAKEQAAAHKKENLGRLKASTSSALAVDNF